ncbi:MAG: NAD-dependent epimerase/dehydratase family protein, partial [bacterium]
MRILLTGCAGFIGSKVAEVLLAEGHTVVGIDNVNAAYDRRLKEWRLAQLAGRAGFFFHRADITDREALDALSLDGAVDAVVNLAARAGVRQSVGDPWIYEQTNVVGTLNLLEFCRARSIGKFVLASTSSLYGALTPRPFQEDADTNRPLSPYAASKKAAEVLSYTYHYLYGLDVTVVRYFTVYGPAGRPDMSIFRFIQWISEGRPVIVYGDGTMERDFTFVEDVARGTVAALRPLGYEIINLGSDHPVTVREVIAQIEARVGAPARVEFHPAHPADVAATWASISKAGRLLAWTPHTPFTDGLD